MSSFGAGNEWLSYEEAGRLLKVAARTVNRWMRSEEMRTILGAVRFGKQWRIPKVRDLTAWATTVQAKRGPQDLKERIRRDVDKACRAAKLINFEAMRLWT